MKGLRLKSTFKRDLKRVSRQHKEIALLEKVVNSIRNGEFSAESHRDHSLKGDWVGWRECHIQPDWLLIYKVTETEVFLARTGTHADLFEK
jgi:mRNA interferase YafQ